MSVTSSDAVPLEPWTDRLEGRSVLVTGSTGYVGSRLVPAFQAAGARVVRLLRPDSPDPADGTTAVRGDPADAATWDAALGAGIDTVVHLAAQTSVPLADRDPLADWHANVAPFLHLLAACERHGSTPTVLLAGTATEVGPTPSHAVDESLREDPVTVYDLHKLTNERYLRHYVRKGAVRGATLRLANVHGPGPSRSASDRGILGMMVRRALDGQDLTLYGDGAFLRDYVYVDDVVRAFAAVAATPDAVAGGEPYLVATGTSVLLRDAFAAVARVVGEETGRAVAVTRVEPPTPLDPIDTRDFVADPSRIAEATGWRARVSLEEGIRRTVRAALARPGAEVAS